MYKYVKILACMIIPLFLIANSYTQEKEKLRIALLDFSTPGGLSKMETITLGNRLRSNLVKTNAFVVLERGKMEEILSEQGFQQTGCTTTECAVEIGRLLNVQKMVSGAIGKIGRTYTIDISLIDISTAQIEKSFFQDYKGEIDGMLDMMEVIANQIAASIIEKKIPAEEKKIFEISIKSNPSGAQISINNTDAGQTPFNRKVREGLKLEIKLQKENYQDWVRTVAVSDDININANLEFTEAYKQKLAHQAKEQRGEIISEEKVGGSPWLWIGGGAILVGGAAYLLLPKSDKGEETTTTDQGFPQPPDRPL